LTVFDVEGSGFDDFNSGVVCSVVTTGVFPHK